MEVEYPVSLLRARNLKVTPTRTRFLKAIHSYGSAMPFTEIQLMFQDTDRVTLYRTIEKLLEKGIIHKAYSEERDTHYALCGGSCTDSSHSHNHIHFECVTCSQITCEELVKPVEITIPNADILEIHVAVKGICERCR